MPKDVNNLTVFKESKLEFFTLDDSTDIEYLAKGMSTAEALAYYGVEAEDLSAYDLKFFKTWFRRGRSTAQSKAVNALFDSMKAKNPQACLSYLTRFAEEWPVNETDKPGTRQFKIVME